MRTSDQHQPILTPDQRLRVFISSTIKELAAERNVVKAAIEEMRMHPVLFEVAARPHPPRDLYRAYLDQSDIFVAIYHESYGWIAPDMDISGIEDEFDLSGEKPKLVYVKGPAPNREPRLRSMLERVSEEGLSYKHFSTTEELGRLLLDDLALLLTERFTQTSSPATAVAGLKTSIPAPFTELIGRNREVADLERLLTEEGARLVTMVGPGGVGKSRMGIEVGLRMADRFADGTHFVMLESVRTSDQVPTQIAASLDLVERLATPDPLELLTRALQDRELLLILDNFEQVLEAGHFLTELLNGCPQLKIMVTSRAVLRLRSEVEYPIEPLGVPAPDSNDADSVQLFLARSRRPVPPSQMKEVAEICRRLDGLPLAIELAAARTSLLTPVQILARLEDRFGLLKGGPADLPDRHKTMHDTIAWSVDLLSEEDRRFMQRAAVFIGGFTLDSASVVCDPEGEIEVIERLQAMIENSLAKPIGGGLDPRFVFYATVREFGEDMLRASGELDEARERHAEHFMKMVLEQAPGLRGSRQVETLNSIQDEEENIHRAISCLIEKQRPVDAARMIWALWPFWWIRGRAARGRDVCRDLLAIDAEIEPFWRTRTIAAAGALALLIGDHGPAVAWLAQAHEELEAEQDHEALGLCKIALGMVSSVIAPENTMPLVRGAIESLTKAGDRYGLSIARNMVCWMDLNMDILEEPEESYRIALREAQELGSMVEVAIATGHLGRKIALTDPHEGVALLRRSILILVDGDMRSGVSFMSDGLAEILSLNEKHELAVRLFHFSDSLLASLDILESFASRKRRNRLLQASKAAIGDPAANEEAERGASLSYEEGIAELLAACSELTPARA